jgi:hypothetical protein
MSKPVDPFFNIDTDEMLDDLISFLDEHESWQNPRPYGICEYFGDKEPREYILYNLTLERDGDIINGLDGYNRLHEEPYCVLNQFLADSVIYIAFQSSQDMITISFEMGYIRIYY